MATLTHKLDSLGGLKISFNELSKIPDPMIDYIERQPNPKEFLKSLFQITTDTKTLENNNLEFTIEKTDKSIAAYIKSKQPIQSKTLSISPIYFNLLKI